MKGLFIALTIVAIAICAPINLTFKPIVDVNLDGEGGPSIVISSIPQGGLQAALGTCTNKFQPDGDNLKATFSGFAELMNCGFEKRVPRGNGGGVPGENGGEAPGENGGEAPGENGGEEPEENGGEEPGENGGEEPGENGGEAPGENGGEAPGENGGEAPGDGSRRNLHKRGFGSVGNKAVTDHDVFESLLTLTNTNGGSTHKMEKNIELWFPKNLLVKDDISVTDNNLVSDFALTSLTFDHENNKWTVKIQFTVQSPYEPKSTIITPPTDFITGRNPTFSVITPGTGNSYTFEITVIGCTDWTASGEISIPTKCISNQNLCVDSTPANIVIDVTSIATASACPVAQVFDFNESIKLYVVDSLNHQPASNAPEITTNPIKVSEFVYIKLFTDEAPANVLPTFSFTRACVKKTADPKVLCGANAINTVQSANGGRDAAVLAKDLFTAYKTLTSSQGHAATFDVVAEFSVTYLKGNTQKRNVVVRRAIQGITIENVEIHSSASVLSFVPLLLAAIAVFLA